MHCVDVHAHLTHEAFAPDLDAVVRRAESAGLGAIIVNGLEPRSNRRVLALAQQFPLLWPALGIYPVDAVCHQIKDLPFPVAPFDVDAELAFIREAAAQGVLAAIGECGLDGYWVGEDLFVEQERVFVALIEIAVEHHLPIIVHSRKREERAFEVLAHYGAKKVNFHCYGGKVRAAVRVAEQYGWYFSIPANARVNQAFRKMLSELPQAQILTETDCPYLAPVKGERSEPSHVVGTVELFAELRGLSVDEAQAVVWKNFVSLFGVKPQRSLATKE